MEILRSLVAKHLAEGGLPVGWRGCRLVRLQEVDDERGGRRIVITAFIGVLVVSLAVLLAVAGLAVIVALILYTIAVLEYPFDDELQVGPDAFELVFNGIEENSS